MNRKTFKEMEREQRQSVKTWAVVAVVIIVAVGGYFASNFGKYQKIVEASGKAEVLAEDIRNDLVETRSGYQEKRVEYDSFYKEAYEKLDNILPAESDYTELTRQIDSFEKQLARRHNPFEVSNISFQGEVEGEGYSILPFRMNIRASRNNFVKFLHLVENSGSLDSSVRLMDISSIRLNFLDSQDADGPSEIINFSVQINAYFQK